MKKLNILKTIELIACILFTIGSILLVFANDSVLSELVNSPVARFLAILLWVTLAAGFIFLFLDFSFITKYKYDYYLLQEQVYNDPLSGLPNRFSCDSIIEKYVDTKLPDHIGCIMLDMTNLYAINNEHGRVKGNEALKGFSKALLGASSALCFVGRNGGNKFLAVFEDCNQKQLDTFLEKVERSVTKFNEENKPLSIEYSYGIAFNKIEQKTHISTLIALSNQRINEGVENEL